MKRIVGLIGGLLAGFFLAGAALASPISAVNVPMDTPQALAQTVVNSINATFLGAQKVQATGSAGASTLNGLHGAVTTESLSTAALTDFTETLTNSSIVASSTVIVSLANGTNTGGDPIVAQVKPGAGSCTIVVRNAHATTALNGTLVLTFVVLN